MFVSFYFLSRSLVLYVIQGQAKIKLCHKNEEEQTKKSKIKASNKRNINSKNT